MYNEGQTQESASTIAVFKNLTAVLTRQHKAQTRARYEIVVLLYNL